MSARSRAAEHAAQVDAAIRERQDRARADREREQRGPVRVESRRTDLPR